MRRLYAFPVLLIALTTAASAQTIVVNPNRQSVVPAAPEARITVGVNMFVRAPNDNSPDAVNARREIYNLAAHECAILHDLFATECRLDSVNVNIQSQPANQFGGQQRIEGFSVNGNISFRIVPK